MRVYKNLFNKGFTLVELLVVIAIIAILFAVVLVAINPAQRFKDSRNSRRLSDVKSIVEAATTYTADRRGAQLPDVPDYQCVGTKPAQDFQTSAPLGSTAFWRGNWTPVITDVQDYHDSSGVDNVGRGALTNSSSSGRFADDAIQFNNSRALVRVYDHSEVQASGALTLETWLKPDDNFSTQSDSSMGLIDKGDYKLFLSDRTGALTFELNPNTADAANLAHAGSKYSFSSFAEYNGMLYAGQGSATGDGVIYQSSDGVNWIISSFPGTQESIFSLAVYKGKLYAGQGSGSGDGVIFSYDGTTNNYGLGPNGWKTEYSTGADSVYGLVALNDKLYAGVGGAANSAEVYEYDGSLWRPLGFSYPNDAVFALNAWGNTLYAATGGPNRAQVLSWDGSNWTQSYQHPIKNYAYAITVFRNKLYVGIGGAADTDAEIRGTSDGIDWGALPSDSGAARETRSLIVYDGKLYAGLGGSIPTYRKIRVFNGSVWSDFYGGSIAPLGGDNADMIRVLYFYNGKLFAGELGDIAGDGDILSFGSTAVLRSAKRTWNANQWYHVAATYDGSMAILYVNGREDARVSTSLTIDNQNLLLYVGYNAGNGFFKGVLDNVVFYQQALDASTIASHAGCYNLGQYLAPEYMGSLPIDPSSAVTDGTDTGYFISKDTGGVITITAPLTETSSSIPEIIKASR